MATVNLREIEITADRVEDLLGGLVEGVDDLGAVQDKLQLDLRRMTALMGELSHNSDEYHNGETILEHTRWVLSDLESLIEGMDDERKVVLRLAALLHDVGKAYTYQLIEGKHTFYKHGLKSAQIAEVLLARHREALGDLYQRVIDLVRLHDLFMTLVNARKGAKDQKYLNDLMREALYAQGHLEDLLTLTRADSARSRIQAKTLESIDVVLADVAVVEERQRAEARYRENLVTMLPQVRDLLRERGLGDIADAAQSMADINRALGRAGQRELLREIERMVGRPK